MNSEICERCGHEIKDHKNTKLAMAHPGLTSTNVQECRIKDCNCKNYPDSIIFI